MNEEGCDIIIDEDLYSSYHLTRRNPINRESIATLTLENAKAANQMQQKQNAANANAKLVFSSVSMSSSNLTYSPHSSPSLNAKLNKAAANTTSTPNSNTGQMAHIHNDESKSHKEEALPAKSEPKLSAQQQQQPFTVNFTNSLNKLMINNGFNSLRKILKFPTASKPQHLAEVFNVNSQSQDKCFSASTTQVSNANTNKTCSSASFAKKSNPFLKNSSQISLMQSNNDSEKKSSKAKPKTTSPPSSQTSSLSRSSSVVVSGSSLSTPSSIMANSNTNVQSTGPVAHTQTLTRNEHDKKKKSIKKQHSFSSTTNAFNFSLFGSATSSSLKNGPHSYSISTSLNKEQEQKKSLNNLTMPKRYIHKFYGFKRIKCILCIVKAKTPRSRQRRYMTFGLFFNLIIFKFSE